MFWRLVLALVSLLVFQLPTFGASLHSLRFEQLKVAQGLPQESVMAIVQDAHGFMWFGSQAGLSRFDGYRVSVNRHDPNEPRSLANNWVQALYVDEGDRLWVGTEGGLQLYEPVSDSFSAYVPLSPDSRTSADLDIRKIIGDGRGGMWLATRHGLHHFDPSTGEFRFYRHDPKDAASLINDVVSSLVRDSDGNLWVGTAEGLDRLEPGRPGFVHFRLGSESNVDPKHNQVTTLTVARDQSLWIGSVVGLEQWSWRNGQLTRRQFAHAEGLERDTVTSILEDRDGRIWVGQLSGLMCLEKDATHFADYHHLATDPTSLSSDLVNSLYQDRTGTLWVGTRTGGVNSSDLAAGGFNRFTQVPGDHNSLSSNYVTGIAPATNNHVWLSTFDGGLNLIDPVSNEVKTYRHREGDRGSLASDRLTHMATDGTSVLWLSTETGVGRFDTSSGRYEALMSGREDAMWSPIDALYMGPSSVLWMSNARGLRAYDTKNKISVQFTHDPKNPDSITDDAILCMLEDRKGNLWLGSTNGLERLVRTTGKFLHVRHDQDRRDSYDGGRVSALFEDSMGRIWVGSATGLSLMDLGANGAVHFKNYPMARVSNILEDDAGHLWVSTDAGISRFEPATGKTKNFTARDGLIEGAYIEHSAMKSADGSFYFGGINGVTVFRPDQIRDNPHPPPVYITDLQIFNRSVRGGRTPDGFSMDGPIEDAKDITLSFQHSVFSIEFSALHFADPQRNIFSYRMEGADKDWINTDASRRIATYTNLQPGHYVFHVKAANKDGVWNTTGVALSITVLPPFWMTWWFRTFALLLILGIAWAIYRTRIQTLIGAQVQLEQQVNLRTVEVVRQKELVEQKKTELELTNKALALANKIQEEHRSELTRFLAVASHDLRQPMHALNLYLGAMRNMEMAEGARPLLANARQCAQIMDEMFLALLDLSRLDAQVVEPQIERFRISTVLSRLAVEFTPQAHAKDVEFYIEPCDVWVETDPALVEQILRNLTANAVRYTESGWIAIACSVEGEVLRVAVQDTGIGISPRQQKTVFEEFFQLGNSSRDRTKGLGLGLAIVKRLSRLLGTPVTLLSAPDQGSTFSLDLPMSIDQTEHTKTVDVRELDVGILRGKQIVVVDDEESILDAMRVLLEQWGCEVVLATSGINAVKQLVANTAPPDALVCDYRLRLNETGADVVHELRVEFNHDIPALLITADTAPERIQETLSSGLPVLHKPVQADALRDALVLLLSDVTA